MCKGCLVVMLCPLHQGPPAVFGYFTVPVGIPTAGRQILKPQRLPHLLFLAKKRGTGLCDSHQCRNVSLKEAGSDTQ